MSASHITCAQDGCGRLVRSATPRTGSATVDFDIHQFCSKRCGDQHLIDSITCRADGCYHMVAQETTNQTSNPPNFDTHKYCTIECARYHYRCSPLEASPPISTCTVCATDKPLTSFIYNVHPIQHDRWGYMHTNITIPHSCRQHIMPELARLETGICIRCISLFLETQLQTLGARGISCIVGTCSPDPEDMSEHHDWLSLAHNFLPPHLHPSMQQQLFDLWLSQQPKWHCPTPSCGITDAILDPAHSPGYPHVHCHGCDGRFCANCRVPWHQGATCQQYRARHPEVQDEGEVRVLRDLARLGARRCPCCQFVVIKEGGCGYMECEECGVGFDWGRAERVVGGWGGDGEGDDEDGEGVWYMRPVMCEMDGIVAARVAA